MRTGAPTLRSPMQNQSLTEVVSSKCGDYQAQRHGIHFVPLIRGSAAGRRV